MRFTVGLLCIRRNRSKEKKMAQNRKRMLIGLFLAPSLCGVLVFQLLPFVDVWHRSFLDAMGRSFVGIENYKMVWGNEAFRMATRNTLHFLAVAIPMLVAGSLVLALLVYRSRAGQHIFKSSLVLPMAIPAAAMVLVWRILFCPDGFLNQILTQMTGEVWEIDWVHKTTAFPILVITYLWKNSGYNMMLWLAGLSAIPESLYDAAQVDGAGELTQLCYITLPCLRGTMGLVFVLSVVNCFRVYREAYLLAGSYPDLSIYMIPHLFSHWFLTLDIQKMSTTAVFLVLAAIAVGGFPMYMGRIGRRE